MEVLLAEVEAAVSVEHLMNSKQNLLDNEHVMDGLSLSKLKCCLLLLNKLLEANSED